MTPKAQGIKKKKKRTNKRKIEKKFDYIKIKAFFLLLQMTLSVK